MYALKLNVKFPSFCSEKSSFHIPANAHKNIPSKSSTFGGKFGFLVGIVLVGYSRMSMDKYRVREGLRSVFVFLNPGELWAVRPTSATRIRIHYLPSISFESRASQKLVDGGFVYFAHICFTCSSLHLWNMDRTGGFSKGLPFLFYINFNDNKICDFSPEFTEKVSKYAQSNGKCFFFLILFPFSKLSTIPEVIKIYE